MSMAMSTEEREAFLAGLHVGVMSIERSDGPPLAVPVWYDYEPGGDLWLITDGSTVKAKLLRQAGRFSMCAQKEDAPYAYVSVEGACRIEPSDAEGHRRPMARRYLGPDGGDWYVDNVAEGPEPIVVHMRPERWFTVDYGKADR